jgi:hypothetical protein
MGDPVDEAAAADDVRWTLKSKDAHSKIDDDSRAYMMFIFPDDANRE